MGATPKPKRAPQVGFVLVTLAIDAFGIGVAIPVVPRLVQELTGRSISGAGTAVALTVSLFALAQFLAAPVLGGLSDRFGRRPVILLSVSGSCLNYVLQAVAPTIGWIYVGRLIAGATAANASCATAYIADVTPPEKRAQRFGLLGATFGLGFVLGPAIGGLVGSVGTRAPFVLAAVLAGLNVLYGLLVLPESLPAERRRPFDLWRANPVGSLRLLLRDRFLLRLAAAWAGLWFGISVLQSTFVLSTEYRFHWGPAANGAVLGLVGLSQAFVQTVLVRRVVARLGESRTALAGCCCYIVSFLMFGFAPAAWVMFPAVLVQAAGSVAAPAIRGMLSAHVGPARQGEMAGSTSSVEGLTQIVAPQLAGWVFGVFTAAAAPVRFGGAPFLLGAVAYALALLFVFLAGRQMRAGTPGAVA